MIDYYNDSYDFNGNLNGNIPNKNILNEDKISSVNRNRRKRFKRMFN